MESIDLLIFYEHVARELDAMCAVKHLCETRHGLRVEIAHQPYGVPHALEHWQPQVVAVPFCYSHSTRNYPFLYDWPLVTVFNLAWEQLFYEGNRAAKLPQGDFERRHVQHHAWGEFFVELLQAQGVPRANIFLNGQPSYMLYAEPYARYFVGREQLADRHGLDAGKRWVFFPENYNWAFYPDWKLAEWEATGIPRERIDAMTAFCRDSFAQVIAWCQAVAAQGQVEVIVRPRPATPVSDFTAAVERAIPGQSIALRIIKDESVREWILASDLVVSSYSTSLIEAAVAGKANYMLEPIPVISALQVDWQAHVARLRTSQEFQAACQSPSPAPRDDRLRRWAGSQMMAHGDALSNLADHLAGLVRRPPPRHTLQRRRFLAPPHPRWAPAWLAFELERLQGARQRRTPRPLTALYESDVVSASEIRARIERWRALLGPAPAGELALRPQADPA